MSTIEGPIFVICHSEDCGDEGYFGPFEDEAWARAWIVQHDNNPYFDSPGEVPSEEWSKWENEILTPREEDENHWCLNSIEHTTTSLTIPGFDPTTLPTYV